MRKTIALFVIILTALYGQQIIDSPGGGGGGGGSGTVQSGAANDIGCYSDTTEISPCDTGDATYSGTQLTVPSALIDAGVNGSTTLSGNSATMDGDTAFADGPFLRLVKSRSGGAASDSDESGEIAFRAVNDAPAEHAYSEIRGIVVDASNGTEDGAILFENVIAGTESVDVMRLERSVIFFDTGTKPTCDATADGYWWYDTTSLEYCLDDGGGYAWKNALNETNVIHPITRYLSPDGSGYVFPDIALNVGTVSGTNRQHDALMRFAMETTSGSIIQAAGSTRIYMDMRDHIPNDFASNITFKVQYSSETASGNYRMRFFWSDKGSGDSLQETQALAENDFTTTTLWTAAGDWSCGSGTCTYTHSSGSGTLTQTAANRTDAGINSMYYGFGYTTSSVAGGGPTCTVTTGFAAEALTLNVDENATTWHEFFSAAAASTGDFVISCTSGASDAITIDDLDLRAVFEEGIAVTDAVPGTTHTMDVVEFTPSATPTAGELLRARFVLDYVDAANTADGVLNAWEVWIEGDQ